MCRKFFFFILITFMTGNSYAQRYNRVDTDGDGVIDRRDVDDDNDGIYDVHENRIRKIAINKWVNRNNVRVYNNQLSFTSGNIGWNNSVNSDPFTSFGFIDNYVVSFNAKVSTKAIIGFGISENGVDYTDVDFGIRFDQGKYSIYKNGRRLTNKAFYRFSDVFRIEYNYGKLKFYKNNIRLSTISVGEGISFYIDTSFKGENGRYKSAYFYDLEINAASGNMDIDGDGILNSLDLDTDGDGCSDVLEAGFEDPDNDGILGEGIPRVNRRGAVISAYGYRGVSEDYVNSSIQVCDSEEYGVIINTVNLPNTEFKITHGELVIDDLISGTDESEVFVEFENDNIENKIILLNVKETVSNAALDIRITKSEADYVIEVFNNGIWYSLSPEFYEISGDKISFVTLNNQKIIPFQLGLVNGVEYNRENPLDLDIDNLISVEGGMWEIISPEGSLISVSPNILENKFTWDGTQASIGLYKFKVTIQGKVFNGQFYIY